MKRLPYMVFTHDELNTQDKLKFKKVQISRHVKKKAGEPRMK